MPYFPTAEDYMEAEARAQERERRAQEASFNTNIAALPANQQRQIRYAQSLANQGYNPADLSAAISVGQDITKIRPTRRAPKTPAQIEKERIALERARLGLEKARTPKAPKYNEYTDPETGAMFFEQNLEGGQVRRTPQLEEGTNAPLYRSKEKAFKGVRYDESGIPIPWTMDRGTYGEAKDYREDMPKFKEYTDPETGEIMRTYEGEQGVVTKEAKTKEGFQRFDPKKEMLWKQEPDPILGVPTVQSKYRVDELGRPREENKWEMEPTQEVKNLHANSLRIADAADKELERAMNRAQSLRYGISEAKAAGNTEIEDMKRQSLSAVERAIEGLKQQKADAQERLAQIEGRLQDQGVLLKVGKTSEQGVEGVKAQGSSRGAPKYDEGKMPAEKPKDLTKTSNQGKQVVKRQRHKKTGQIREVYSDGTSQIIQ